MSVLASLASAVVWMGELPVKLNPVIQPLMAAIKREQVQLEVFSFLPLHLYQGRILSMSLCNILRFCALAKCVKINCILFISRADPSPALGCRMKHFNSLQQRHWQKLSCNVMDENLDRTRN